MLGVLSVGPVLLGYHYYQDHKASTAAQLTAANNQEEDSSHTVKNELLIQKSGAPLDQDNIHNPEDGFDQNIDNMFKVAKPASANEPANTGSPFDSAFGVQAQKPFPQTNDKIKPLTSQPQTIRSSTTSTKDIQQSEKNVELKTASTSTQEQSPAKTPQESSEVAQS
ncbi:hypothetical protein [Acinetobacter schindleri]|uniref:hypothetical protein n=1 Tax=Acinetobacter schindleri TaxID=108981 RepID=UPI003340BE71